MRCSAGNEYLHIHHDGTVARCTCRRAIKHEVIGDIVSFEPVEWIECDLAETCEHNWLGDWNRSSRENGRGEFAPECGELATKLTLTSRCNFKCHYCHPERVKITQELTPEQWIWGLSRLRHYYKRCRHHIQGTVGEPMLYKGVEKVVRAVAEMGDHVTFISNFSCNENSLKAMISTCSPDSLRFGASMHFTDPGFDMEGFRRRILVVKEAGHYIEVLVVACPSQIFIINDVAELFRVHEIPVRAFYASCQPSTPITQKAFEYMMEKSTSSKTVFT